MKFSPISLDNPERIELVADLLQTVIRNKDATYISVPITTGKRFVTWWRDRGRVLDHQKRTEVYHEEHYRAVIQPNLDDAQKQITAISSQVDGVVIEPTLFKRPEWNQIEFRFFWGKVIEKFVSVVIFLDGWEYSSGCTFEYLVAHRCGVTTLDQDRKPLKADRALQLIKHSLDETRRNAAPVAFVEKVFEELQSDSKLGLIDEGDWSRLIGLPTLPRSESGHYKDAILNALAEVGNVAQFVSFDPELRQRYSRVAGFEPNFRFGAASEAIEALLANSPEGMLNVRSYRPEQPKGQPLRYGLKSTAEVLQVLDENRSAGNYSIVNETVDIRDGGVSGVILGDLVEFSPDDSPKCVDKPGVCALPRDIGISLLEKVYSFRPLLSSHRTTRVEFSIHPKRRGLRREHTLLWEVEHVPGCTVAPAVPDWPNNFSRLIGDKAFGLLIADALGLRVPKTTVISRRIAPFTFGRSTGTGETWIRTCPRERAPGKYPTLFGWHDPFKMLALEDAKQSVDSHYVPIVSVLSQDAAEPAFSGSCCPFFSNDLTIEGRRGRGDEFMVGQRGPEPLPEFVQEHVRKAYAIASQHLGPVEIEWVYDGTRLWVVQLHRAKHPVLDHHSGHVEEWHRFEVTHGLEKLQDFCSSLNARRDGVVLVGDVGVTSHFGDILRSLQLPFRIEKP